MNCKVIGTGCIKEKCRQWNAPLRSCRLSTNIGRILYHPWNGMELFRFLKYLEEIKPE